MPRTYDNEINNHRGLNEYLGHTNYLRRYNSEEFNVSPFRITPRQSKLSRIAELEGRLPVGVKENVGTVATILASGVDGSGNRSKYDSLHFAAKAHELRDRLSGNLLKRLIGRLAASEVVVVEDAKKLDLKDAIQDREVKSVYLLGHGTYHSVRLSDASVDWYDVGMMVDGHQKNGVFANLGCGLITERGHDPIPLGRYAISENGVLLGKEGVISTFGEMADLTQYSALAA